jgi:bacteriocin-like protein
MTRFPASKGSELPDRELHDDELNAVTGGIIAVLIGLLLSDARPSAPPPPPSK